MEARAAPIGQRSIGPTPFSLPRPLRASRSPSPPSPRPQPPDPMPVFGWADPGRSGPAELRGHTRPPRPWEAGSLLPQKTSRGPENTIGALHVLTFKGVRPRPRSCLSPWLPKAKASYLQPEPSELLGMPSPTVKTWRSSSVSISIILFLQAAVIGGFYRQFYL